MSNLRNNKGLKYNPQEEEEAAKTGQVTNAQKKAIERMEQEIEKQGQEQPKQEKGVKQTPKPPHLVVGFGTEDPRERRRNYEWRHGNP